jgi:hypothetical protein
MSSLYKSTDTTTANKANARRFHFFLCKKNRLIKGENVIKKIKLISHKKYLLYIIVASTPIITKEFLLILIFCIFVRELFFKNNIIVNTKFIFIKFTITTVRK